MVTSLLEPNSRSPMISVGPRSMPVVPLGKISEPFTTPPPSAKSCHKGILMSGRVDVVVGQHVTGRRGVGREQHVTRGRITRACRVHCQVELEFDIKRLAEEQLCFLEGIYFRINQTLMNG